MKKIKKISSTKQQNHCDNLEWQDGVVHGREVQDKEDIHIPMADSC